MTRFIAPHRERFAIATTALLLLPACQITSTQEPTATSRGRSSVAGSAAATATGAPAGDKPDTPDDPSLRRFAYRFVPGVELHYVIENQFRESGGVPPLLSYSTSIKDRKTVSQRVMSNRAVYSGDGSNPLGPISTLIWKFERYEVEEQGMKGKASYDSVRHSYPPPSLWDLGGIAGAKCSISAQPDGKAAPVSITLAKVAGGDQRSSPSKLASKCKLVTENLAELLKDMGPFWMPDGPVRVGDRWSRVTIENMKTFGNVKTEVDFTFRSLDRLEDREIASIEFVGNVTLEPPTNSAASQPTSRPGRPAPPQQKPREFQIDRSVCSGSIKFDLTLGRLLELNIRRELSFVAHIESEKSGPMELRTGSAHFLKVASSVTAPPMPVIIGGPVPPPIPPSEKITPRAERRVAPPASRPTSRVRPAGATSRPASSTTRPGLPRPRGTTTQPEAPALN